MGHFDDWDFDEYDIFNMPYDELDYYDYDEHEYYDPATDIIDVIELGIEVTVEGYLLEREILIFADGHEEPNQRILVMTCWDGKLPF